MPFQQIDLDNWNRATAAGGGRDLRGKRTRVMPGHAPLIAEVAERIGAILQLPLHSNERRLANVYFRDWLAGLSRMLYMQLMHALSAVRQKVEEELDASIWDIDEWLRLYLPADLDNSTEEFRVAGECEDVRKAWRGMVRTDAQATAHAKTGLALKVMARGYMDGDFWKPGSRCEAACTAIRGSSTSIVMYMGDHPIEAAYWYLANVLNDADVDKSVLPKKGKIRHHVIMINKGEGKVMDPTYLQFFPHAKNRERLPNIFRGGYREFHQQVLDVAF